jgi:hypothetical protein
VRYFLRWWETLGRAERIVALSIGLGAPIAVINSTVWAVAVAYMVHEKSRVELERLRVQASRPTEQAAEGHAGWPDGARARADQPALASVAD